MKSAHSTSSGSKLDLTVVLPTLNEAKNLPILIPKIERFFVKQKLNAEILIVDDKGHDNTPKVAYTLNDKYGNIRVIERPVREGAGAAHWQGIQEAHGNIIITMEADNSCDPEDMKKILDKIEQGFDVVVASRYAKGGKSTKGFIAALPSRAGNEFVALLHGIPVHDFTFAYRGFKKSVVSHIKPIEKDGNPFLMEFVVKAKRDAKAKIAEVPVIFTKRSHGVSKNRVLKAMKRTLFATIRIKLSGK